MSKPVVSVSMHLYQKRDGKWAIRVGDPGDFVVFESATPASVMFLASCTIQRALRSGRTLQEEKDTPSVWIE